MIYGYKTVVYQCYIAIANYLYYYIKYKCRIENFVEAICNLYENQ